MSGMKSAYELAMERLEAREGKHKALTDGQKAKLAAIDEQTQAKIAEIQIMMEGRLAEARATGDPSKVREVEDERVAEIGRTRSRAESEKDDVRKAG